MANRNQGIDATDSVKGCFGYQAIGPWRPREVEAYARWVLATAALVVESSQPASRRWVVDVAYRLNALHPHDRCFLTAQESGLASALRRWAALDQRDADTSTVREAMRRALSVPL